MALIPRVRFLGLIARGPTHCISAPPTRVFLRGARYQAFDADFDPKELDEARAWHKSFNHDSLPKGQTSFARSSGPGGQHVNKYVLRFETGAACS